MKKESTSPLNYIRLFCTVSNTLKMIHKSQLKGSLLAQQGFIYPFNTILIEV